MYSIGYQRNGVYNTKRIKGTLNKIMCDLYDDSSINWFRIKKVRGFDIVTVDTLDHLITISKFIDSSDYDQVLKFQSKVYYIWKSIFLTEVY